MQRRGRSLALFCTATFLFWASLYLYVPILPVYAELLGGTMTTIGLVVSSYGIAQLIVRVPLGVWSDRLGRRKPFVMAGIAIAGMGALGLALSPDVWSLFAARTLTGLGAAAWVPFTVLFASFFPRERTTRAIAIITLINGAAEMISTYGGGFVAQGLGWQATFYIAALLAFLGVLCMVKVDDNTVPVRKDFSLRGVFRVASVPLLLWVSSIALLINFINFGINLNSANLYAANLGATRADLGTMTAVMFAAQCVASLALSAFAYKTNPRLIVVIGFLLYILGNLAVPFITTVPLMTGYQAVTGIGRGLTRPVLMGLSILAVPASERATAMGVYQAVYAIGMTIGPAVSGAWGDTFGLSSVFVMAAGIALVGTILSVVKVPTK